MKTDEIRPGTRQVSGRDGLSLYVHIPFCVRKCLYCDFYSVSAGKETQEQYFETLMGEIKGSGEDISGEALLGEGLFGEARARAETLPVVSVFFGGGTPSHVEARHIVNCLNALRKRYRILDDAEITLEANPGTLTKDKLKCYQDAGFNRLSLGLQSADDRLLKKLGRIHTWEDFLSSFEMARAAGFENINIDLMSALPGDTPQNFEKGLKNLLTLSPEHFSVYSLIIAENTPFYALYGPQGTDLQELPTEDEDRTLVHRTREILTEAGYRQYEISNYAKPGFASVHNIGYWTGRTYLGFGAGASSFFYTNEERTEGRRVKNAEALDYTNLPKTEEEQLLKEDLMAEFMILGLRMTEGVKDREFRIRFGCSFFEIWQETIEKYLRFNVLLREGDRLYLSPYGQDVCSLLFEEFL